MMRPLLAALLLSSFAFQDGTDPARIAALLDQLGSDDIVAVDDAQIELVKAGTAAEAPVRERLRDATGELKARLESVLARIGRARRAEAAMGRPVRVTLKGARPLAEHLEELKKRTGLALEWSKLPPEPVELDLVDATPWQALAEACRARGGVDWTIGEQSVVVAPGTPRTRPLAAREQFAFVLEQVQVTTSFHNGGSSTSVQVFGFACWPAGAQPSRAQLAISRFVDDKDTDLLPRRPGFGMMVEEGDPRSERPVGAIRQALRAWGQTPPGEGATKIAVLKGEAQLRFVLDSRKLAVIESPGRDANAQATFGAKGRFTLKKFSRTAGSVSATAELSWTSDDPVSSVEYQVATKEGKARPLKARQTRTSISHSLTGRTTTIEVELRGQVGEADEIAALEVTVPSDVEDVDIPFEFRDLLLK